MYSKHILGEGIMRYDRVQIWTSMRKLKAEMIFQKPLVINVTTKSKYAIKNLGPNKKSIRTGMHQMVNPG